jgi:voltage-gated potassium channel Kch
MKKITLMDRLRYRFDNTMSRGTVALIAWLFVLSVILIVIVSLVVVVAGIAPVGENGRPLSFPEIAWMSLMRTLDAGTMGGDTGSWPFLLSMFAVTLGGVFVISMLIGVLTSGIEGKLEDLRKGRSKVTESGHTVILGWSDQVFTIIPELVTANENQRRSCIVIMGNKDKVEMEDEIHEQVGSTGRTRLVCRTGNPIDMADLEIVSLHSAKSIVVLSPDGDDPDSQVIKTILAITNNPDRKVEPYHIVAEIRDRRNLEVARMVGKDEVEVVSVGELVARVIAQTCRQSGLSVVYTELLDFGGDEIYFQAEPGLTGKTFGEALLMYEDSAVIALHPKGGAPALKPPLNTRIQDGDRIIAISEDDDTVRLSGLTDLHINFDAIQTALPVEPKPERTLILGWNWRAPMIINELDHYVAPGSALTVVADVAEGETEIAHCCSDLMNQAVTFKQSDTTDRRTLDELAVTAYDHVIVLCYDLSDVQQADARTLITLLHLRDIAESAGHPFSIVSEMLDVRNRNLAEVTHADDFIVSDKLVSLMMAQIAENKALNAVFADIFDPEGSEIYIKPATNYVKAGIPVNFYTVMEAAQRRDEVAIGYRLQAHANDAAKAYGVVVNPDKSDIVTFGERDRIVVVAED